MHAHKLSCKSLSLSLTAAAGWNLVNSLTLILHDAGRRGTTSHAGCVDDENTQQAKQTLTTLLHFPMGGNKLEETSWQPNYNEKMLLLPRRGAPFHLIAAVVVGVVIRTNVCFRPSPSGEQMAERADSAVVISLSLAQKCATCPRRPRTKPASSFS